MLARLCGAADGVTVEVRFLALLETGVTEDEAVGVVPDVSGTGIEADADAGAEGLGAEGGGLGRAGIVDD